MHPLYHHIKSVIDISEEDFNSALPYFKTEHFKRKTRIIQPEQTIQHQYFVVKGCLHSYLLDKDGNEHTIQFAIENWWTSDYIAYYINERSILNVECLEDCELMKVNRSDLQEIFKQVPAFEHFFLSQQERAFDAFQKRILSNLHMTASDRYERFTQQYQNIEQRVKNYQIASYFGVTPESLSRIRKELAKK